MVFKPGKLAGDLPEVPDTVPICDFVLNEEHGRMPIAKSWNPYVCGLTGSTFTMQEQKDRVDSLARSLHKELGWNVNEGTEYDKVAGVFALNTIDIMTLNWAIHRLNGVSSPANAAYSAEELRHQLENSGSTCLFTVLPLLDTALKAAEKAKIPNNRIYICEMPGDKDYPKEFKRLSTLTKEGVSLPKLEPIKWSKGQGERQTAFLCYSSGTSGLPKGVMISHRNVIANTLQISVYDVPGRKHIGGDNYQDVALGLLPQSHIYGLIVICHASTYRGDKVVILPKFDMTQYLTAISHYKINTLYIVPPIIINMVKNQKLLSKYDLSSVKQIFTGAAPLGRETAEELNTQYPTWQVRQGYGLTETCTVVCSSSPFDIVFGSSGCLLPGYEAKVMSVEGNEITGYDQPGELLVKSPSVVLGYLKNEKATKETFVDMAEGRFMRTGDEVEIRKSEKGNEHIWVVDRIKELIKVKVSPAAVSVRCLRPAGRKT
jgi:acyl-CoA synthetase (AMP-forming)/AMP-acid ligase II